MSAIIAEALTRSYRGNPRPAIDQLSFTINDNEIFGLIGPDGAGKTTLFRILATLLLADKGSATLNGRDVVKDYQSIRKTIGYMPGKFSLYPDLTVEENLHFFATVFGTTVKANYDLIKEIYIQLEPFKKRPAGKLSGGMKQKLALCCALIHKPEILLLDEPTTGVDPVSRKEFWEMLRKLKEQKITIMVSTPYMDEADQCDRIALIQEGKFLGIDSPEGIRRSYNGDLYALCGGQMYGMLREARANTQVTAAYAFGEKAHVNFRDPEKGKPELEALLQAKGFSDARIEKIAPTIEDCFISMLR